MAGFDFQRFFSAQLLTMLWCLCQLLLSLLHLCVTNFAGPIVNVIHPDGVSQTVMHSRLQVYERQMKGQVLFGRVKKCLRETRRFCSDF